MTAELAAPREADAPPESVQLPPPLQLAANIWFVMLLGYLVVMPAGLLHIGVPLFALTGGCGVLRWLLEYRRTFHDVRVVLLGFLLAGAIPVVLGVIASTPGWRDVAVPLVGGPLLWFFVSHLPDRQAMEWVAGMIAVATIVLSLIIILLVADIGTDLVQLLRPGANGFASNGEARVNFTGVSSLIAVVPFLGAYAVGEARSGELRGGRRVLIVGALVLGLVAAMLSGRQGVVGAIVLTPALMLLTSGFGFRHRQVGDAVRRGRLAIATVAVVVVGIVVAARLGLDPIRLPKDLFASIGILDEGGNQRVERGSRVRAAQGASLLDGWRESPLFGKGGGAVSPDFFTWRGYQIGTAFTDTPRPWRAELSYHLLLFEAGLVGIAGYVAATAYALRRLLARYDALDAHAQRLFRASVVAALAVAIATAVNPIARAVGHQLMLFLPVIVMAAMVRPGADHGVDDAEPDDGGAVATDGFDPPAGDPVVVDPA